MTKHTITISPSGRIHFIYSDHLAALMGLGATSIQRASFVEPDAEGRWTADMGPVSPGTVLGPFRLRGEALDAEIAWLESWLGRGAGQTDRDRIYSTCDPAVAPGH